ncbi:unnamed protein product [Linum trigynum]|uniref:Uncharacterized protein n=1 Tax=Linum trigynum TaxID=586398 RepID=A0AAV2D303_9ROSI
MKRLWEDYSKFIPIVPCICALGQILPCLAVEAFKAKQETDYLVRFVKGVNLAYDVVKTHLLMMKSLPTVVVAYGDLLQHGHKLKSDKGRNTQSVALASYGRQTNQGKGNNAGRQVPKQGSAKGGDTGLFCRYCKTTYHNFADCWKLKRKNKELMLELVLLSSE